MRIDVLFSAGGRHLSSARQAVCFVPSSTIRVSPVVSTLENWELRNKRGFVFHVHFKVFRFKKRRGFIKNRQQFPCGQAGDRCRRRTMFANGKCVSVRNVPPQSMNRLSIRATSVTWACGGTFAAGRQNKADVSVGVFSQQLFKFGYYHMSNRLFVFEQRATSRILATTTRKNCKPRAGNRRGQINPKMFQVSGHNGRSKRAGGIHGRAANWPCEHRFQADHRANGNSRRDALFLCTRRNVKNHEHQKERQNQFQDE